MAVDEARQVFSDVLRTLEGHGVDALDLQRLHEALHHRVVVGVATPSHRADQAVFVEQGPVGLGGVLRASDALMFVKLQVGR